MEKRQNTKILLLVLRVLDFNFTFKKTNVSEYQDTFVGIMTLQVWKLVPNWRGLARRNTKIRLLVLWRLGIFDYIP